MTYKTYLSALDEKRFWKTIGFYAVITSVPAGWRCRVLKFVGFGKEKVNG